MYFTFQPVAQSHAVQQPPKLPPTSKGKVSTLEDLYVGNSWVTMARFDSHGAISHSNQTSTVTMVGNMDVASFCFNAVHSFANRHINNIETITDRTP